MCTWPTGEVVLGAITSIPQDFDKKLVSVLVGEPWNQGSGVCTETSEALLKPTPRSFHDGN